MTLLTPEELAAIRERLDDWRDSAADGGPPALWDACAGVAALFAHIDALTPRWQDGEPFVGESRSAVLREGRALPVVVRRLPDGRVGYINSFHRWEPWGSARWCPIRVPQTEE